MELFRQLPEGERAELLKMLGEAQDGNEDLETMLTEKRFSGGRVCPICGGVHVQRNGRRANGSQKFVCKDCGKTFSIRKNTIFSGTHKSGWTRRRSVAASRTRRLSCGGTRCWTR